MRRPVISNGPAAPPLPFTELYEHRPPVMTWTLRRNRPGDHKLEENPFGQAKTCPHHRSHPLSRPAKGPATMADPLEWTPDVPRPGPHRRDVHARKPG